MFDKLIDSTSERRKRRFLRYLFGTSLLYLLALTAGLVVSVVLANPEMIHPSDLKFTANVAPPPKGNPNPPQTRQQATRPTQPDIYNPAPLDEQPPIQTAEPAAHQSNNPPRGDPIEGVGDPNGVLRGGDPHSPGFISGALPDRRSAPEPPEPPPPVVASKPSKPDAQSMLKIPSTVLQGKAIDRRTPVYPRIATLTKVHGPVMVEVIISPEGRVESARAISGPPLAQAGRRASRALVALSTDAAQRGARACDGDHHVRL